MSGSLNIKSMAFPESKLVEWKQGNYDMLDKLPQSSFLRRILSEKIQNRRNLGQRFFGETFVATNTKHEDGWFGSFKWLSSWPSRSGSEYASEYREALTSAFPDVIDLSSKSKALFDCPLLKGKKPVPPDLWLVVNGEHRFIEVKLPRDDLRPTQLAGLALIATWLSTRKPLSVWVYNLYPKGAQPCVIKESVLSMYHRFCEICTRLKD